MIPWILFGISSVALMVSVFYNYKFAKIILKVEDSITDSLDQLDECYFSISKVLDIPVFYDSPQIRQVVKEMKRSRDSILLVANQIASIEETTDGQKEESSAD